MEHLDHYDKLIIHFLANRGPSNTNEIADKVGISWATAREHLQRLSKMKYVVSAQMGRATVWKVWGA